MSKSPILFAIVLLAASVGTAAVAQSSARSTAGAPSVQAAPNPSTQQGQNATQGARMRRVEGLQTMPYPPPASSAGGASAQRPVDERHCLRQTGSHIPPKEGKCIPMPGRVYDKTDIDRTGENRLGPALKKLDPSVGGR